MRFTNLQPFNIESYTNIREEDLRQKVNDVDLGLEFISIYLEIESDVVNIKYTEHHKDSFNVNKTIFTGTFEEAYIYLEGIEAGLEFENGFRLFKEEFGLK